ncbi:MAG: ABC transporter substrate-binding protein [Rhodospirillaceae bacterium]|nr:ABC transporter substrate-binding protein [Rhodospirillaceae bacterium]
MFKKIARTAVFALSAAFSLACTAAEAGTIKIGVEPWLGYGPLWVADQKGFYKQQGLDVELVMFNTDQDMTAALASGKIDLIAAATNTTLITINQGVPVVGVLVLDQSFNADAILSGAKISSIKDLKGRSVAYERGASSELLIHYALKANGMTPADIKPVPMNASDAGLALIAGRVDAAVTYEPYISTALKQGGNYKVLYTASEKPGLISDLLIGTPDWVKAHQKEVAAVIRAWDSAVRFVRENPAEGGAIIAKAVGSSMDEFEPAFKGVRLFDGKENLEILKGEFQDTVQVIGEVMLTTSPEDVKRIVPASELLSLDALKAAEVK